ncbi:uncharacterized protein LOC124279005 isoform X2 [Haliotis rubra]|uniref:uncharacterized protein LOC124279005 isoform X2 n=1 Tax=Haliotis rubra TaxID=36100 RepID=UPI001EE5DDE8|nr:uncharacterized protein LOC124279005 isoform X2 [Haliotis rubra]
MSDTNAGLSDDDSTLQSPGQTLNLDSTEVTIKAGHYTVTVSHDILDAIVNFFNAVDANADDVIDSVEVTDQWELLDADSDGVLSAEEIHGKMTWFELYALDVDGDGIATNTEFEKATKSLDLDGNGKVELNEFIVMNALVRNQNIDKHNTYRR